MLRLGLCCLFNQAPIRFRSATAKFVRPLDRPAQLVKLSELCLDNARSLVAAVEEVYRLGFGSFRVSSPLLRLYTHPEVGYRLEELPDAREITATLRSVKALKEKHQLRFSFHPDQFTLLSSPRPEVTAASLKELDYQVMLAELIGADVINIHGGGVYGDKQSALSRLVKEISALPEPIRSRLTLENDDRSYTVEDLLPVCAQLEIPLVYDVHHHRCLADGITVKNATDIAIATWNREPLFHLSSPKLGWNGSDPKPHSDMIDPGDFPECWRDKAITIEVEAKAKEIAIEKLIKDLRDMDFPAKRLQKQ